MSQELTRVWVGIKTQHLSIFLKQRLLISCDGKPWPLLEGLVVVNTNPRVDFNILVQVRCTLFSKTKVNSLLETLLYDQHLVLPIQEYNDGPMKIPFEFDFGSSALPPSLFLSKDIRIEWNLTGFLLTVSHSQKLCSCSMPFIVAYQHSTKSVGHKIASPVTGLRRFSLFASLFQSSSPMSVCASFLQPSLYKPCHQMNACLKLKIDANHLSQTQSISLVQVHLRQQIKILLSSDHIGRDVHFSEKVLLLQDKLAPRYDYCETAQSLLYSINPDAYSDKLQNASKAFGLLIMPSSNQLIPSTPLHSSASKVDGVSVHLDYVILVCVRIVDYSVSKYLGSEIEWTCTLPITIALNDHSEFPVTLQGSTFSMHSMEAHYESSNPDLTLMDCSFDNIGHFASEILNDVSSSLTSLRSLLASVSNHQSSSHMVTSIDDHLHVLIYYLKALHKQASVFTLPCSSALPSDPIPVNILVLEIELLKRFVDDDCIIKTILKYLETYRDYVAHWLSSVGGNSSQFKRHQRLFSSLESTYTQSLQLLKDNLINEGM